MSRLHIHVQVWANSVDPDKGLYCLPFYLHLLYEPGHEKMCLMSYANNKGADQPAQSDQRLCCSLLR